MEHGRERWIEVDRGELSVRSATARSRGSSASVAWVLTLFWECDDGTWKTAKLIEKGIRTYEDGLLPSGRCDVLLLRTHLSYGRLASLVVGGIWFHWTKLPEICKVCVGVYSSYGQDEGAVHRYAVRQSV
jgi:hypothetical protein